MEWKTKFVKEHHIYNKMDVRGTRFGDDRNAQSLCPLGKIYVFMCVYIKRGLR